MSARTNIWVGNVELDQRDEAVERATLLVLDEPTGALDPNAEWEVLEPSGGLPRAKP
jgi:ABC-type polar amino acid transport system ATPase subunit